MLPWRDVARHVPSSTVLCRALWTFVGAEAEVAVFPKLIAGLELSTRSLLTGGGVIDGHVGIRNRRRHHNWSHRPSRDSRGLRHRHSIVLFDLLVTIASIFVVTLVRGVMRSQLGLVVAVIVGMVAVVLELVTAVRFAAVAPAARDFVARIAAVAARTALAPVRTRGAAGSRGPAGGG